MAMKNETVMLGATHPGSKLEVLYSPAGWYLGFRKDGIPYTRETAYFNNITTAQDTLSWFRKT